LRRSFFFSPYALFGFGVAALLALGLLVWGIVISVPSDAKNVEVVAQQWYWNYRLPGKGG